MGPNGSEVRSARLAEAVAYPGGGRDQRRHRRVLRVEQSQRIRLQPPPFQFGKLAFVAPEIGRQLFQVRRPARPVADRVEQNLDVRQAGLHVEAVAHLDDLGVDCRARIADRFCVPLPELAVAARLRAVVAEHRTDHGQLHRLRPGVHAVLHERPDDAGRRLRPKRPRLRLLASRRQPEQLLLDDVRGFADPALEDGRLLEHRDLHLAVAITAGERPSDPFEPIQAGADVRKQIAGAPGGAK